MSDTELSQTALVYLPMAKLSCLSAGGPIRTPPLCGALHGRHKAYMFFPRCATIAASWMYGCWHSMMRYYAARAFGKTWGEPPISDIVGTG